MHREVWGLFQIFGSRLRGGEQATVPDDPSGQGERCECVNHILMKQVMHVMTRL